MRASLGLASLVVVLLVLTPLVSASTFETWVDGIYDAESADFVQSMKSAECVIEYTPLLLVRCLPVVEGLAMTGDDPTAPAAVLTAPPGRAPPSS